MDANLAALRAQKFAAKSEDVLHSFYKMFCHMKYLIDQGAVSCYHQLQNDKTLNKVKKDLVAAQNELTNAIKKLKEQEKSHDLSFLPRNRRSWIQAKRSTRRI